MMGRIRGLRPSYASVTATLALVLAIGMGGAYAAQKITSKAIAPSAVKSKHIKNSNVKAPDLAVGAVNEQALADGSVNGLKIADGTVMGIDISAGAVGSSKLDLDSVNKPAIGPNSVGDSELAVTLRRNQVNIGPNTTGNVTVECQSDEVPVGGAGGFISGPNNTLAGMGQVGNGWYATGRNLTGSFSTLSADAYCLKL